MVAWQCVELREADHRVPSLPGTILTHLQYGAPRRVLGRTALEDVNVLRGGASGREREVLDSWVYGERCSVCAQPVDVECKLQPQLARREFLQTHSYVPRVSPLGVPAAVLNEWRGHQKYGLAGGIGEQDAVIRSLLRGQAVGLQLESVGHGGHGGRDGSEGDRLLDAATFGGVGEIRVIPGVAIDDPIVQHPRAAGVRAHSDHSDTLAADGDARRGATLDYI
jgi:hypothetical protein